MSGCELLANLHKRSGTMSIGRCARSQCHLSLLYSRHDLHPCIVVQWGGRPCTSSSATCRVAPTLQSAVVGLKVYMYSFALCFACMFLLLWFGLDGWWFGLAVVGAEAWCLRRNYSTPIYIYIYVNWPPHETCTCIRFKHRSSTRYPQLPLLIFQCTCNGWGRSQ